MKKIHILLAGVTLVINTSAFADFHEKVKRKINHPTSSHESSQMQMEETTPIKLDNGTNEKSTAQGSPKKNKLRKE